MQANGDGKLYGDRALTVLVVAFLTVMLPWICAGAINIAYNTSTVTTKAFPDAPNNYTHGVTWHTWENNSALAGAPQFDCVPYDHLTSTSGQYPAAPYQLNSSVYALKHPTWVGMIAGQNYENLTFRNIGSPFEAQSGQTSCSTNNDVIGFRLDPAIALANAGLGQTMLRWNASILQPSNWLAGLLNQTYAEFDWWIEIDGEYMFGEEVRYGDPDSEIFPIEWWNMNGAYPVLSVFPTLQFDHSLNPVEERRVRDTLADANLSSMNVSFFLKCYDSAGFIWEACGITEDVGSTMDWDWYFHAETEWVAADDYDLIIQGTAFVLSLLSLAIALASTPLWNPLASRLRGVA